MAGPIRQQIDLDSFDRYLRDHVPEIKTPVEVKQVRRPSHWIDQQPDH